MCEQLVVAGLKVAGGLVITVFTVKVLGVDELVRQQMGGKGRRLAHHGTRVHNAAFEKETFIKSLVPAEPYRGALVSRNPLGWQVDRAVLERMMGREPHLRDDLELSAGLLISSLQMNRGQNRYNKYSSTFGTGALDFHGNVTPQDAVQALLAEFEDHGMSNRAIYILGGLFVVATEAERRRTEEVIHALPDPKNEEEVDALLAREQKGPVQMRWGQDRMRSGTAQDTSRLTWKLTVYRPWSGHVRAVDLIRSTRAIATSSPPHGVVRDGAVTIIGPTTVYGSSATIMKVMKKCEALGLNPRQCLAVAFAVAQHWLDKHLSGKRDRHSLLEALHGAFTYLGFPEDHANQIMAAEIRRLGDAIYGNPMKGYIGLDAATLDRLSGRFRGDEDDDEESSGGASDLPDWVRSLDGYLDDEALRRYFEVLRRTYNYDRRRRTYDDRSTINFIDPARSYLLLNQATDRDAAPLLRNDDAQNADVVFFPINNNADPSRPSGGTHWTLIVYYSHTNEFHYYDSQNRAPGAIAIAAHRRLRALYGGTGSPLIQKRAPQQRESECGAWMLLTCEHLADCWVNGHVPAAHTLPQRHANPRQVIRDALLPGAVVAVGGGGASRSASSKDVVDRKGSGSAGSTGGADGKDSKYG